MKFFSYLKWQLGLVILILASCLMGCKSEPEEKLILGTSADYPPFEFIQNGKIVGIDVDVARLIANKLNKKLIVQDMDFSSFIPALNSGKVDFFMAGLSISEERKKNIDFSVPYYDAQFSILTLENKSISTITDLKNKKIGVQLGSIMETFLKELQESTHPNLEIESLLKNIPLIQNLKLGRLDGVLVEDIQAKSFVQANPELRAHNLPGSQGEYAIALAKNSRLTAEVNTIIEELKNNGELERIKEKWLVQNADAHENAQYAWVLYIVKGLGVTLQYTFFSVAFGLVIGIFLSLARMTHRKMLVFPAKVYISIFRGTPLLLQLSFVYFALPGLTGYDISIFMAGIVAFSLNSAAYVSEIIRAGIQSVDKGQFEAAKSLGIPYRLMMQDIILPQSFRNILPALVNELVNMLKESAIISTIGAADLMKRAQVISAEQYTYFAPLLVAAACYYITVLVLSFCAGKLEKKLSVAHHD